MLITVGFELTIAVVSGDIVESFHHLVVYQQRHLFTAISAGCIDGDVGTRRGCCRCRRGRGRITTAYTAGAHNAGYFCRTQRLVVQTNLIQQAIKSARTRPSRLVAQGDTGIAVGDAAAFGCAGGLHAVFIDNHIAAIIHGRYMIPLPGCNRTIASDECAGGAVGFETEAQLCTVECADHPIMVLFVNPRCLGDKARIMHAKIIRLEPEHNRQGTPCCIIMCNANNYPSHSIVSIAVQNTSSFSVGMLGAEISVTDKPSLPQIITADLVGP